MERQTIVVQKLLQKHLWAATAESCTGGLVAAALTDVPGSSQVFGCGVVSYSNEMKEQLLSVDAYLLETYGAVSPQVACAMAEGLSGLSGADICVSITGIAGPDGGSTLKPVGLVYIGVYCKGSATAYEQRFHGNRQEIRRATVAQALCLLEAAIDQMPEKL